MKVFLKTAAMSAAFALAACGSGASADQTANASNGIDAELNQFEAAIGTLENVADNATGNASEAVSNHAEAVSDAADALANTSTNGH